MVHEVQVDIHDSFLFIYATIGRCPCLPVLSLVDILVYQCYHWLIFVRIVQLEGAFWNTFKQFTFVNFLQSNNLKVISICIIC